MLGLQEGVPKVVIAIYLEAEDFEAMKKVGAVQPWPQSWAQCNSRKCFEMLRLNIFFSKVARVTQSRYIVNAINYFNGVYHQPTFVIRLSVSFVDIELDESSSR